MAKVIQKTWFTALLAAMAFCGSAAQPVTREAPPLRVAVFVGKGTRGEGAFRWIEIASRMKNAVMTPVDGVAIQGGALDAADVLVMPGGWSGHEAQDLGEKGREKVRAFVKGGGGYVGTCAGCCLLMESSKGHPDMVHMRPYKFGQGGGETDISVKFNRRAEELAGIKKGTVSLRYAYGPVPLPSIPVPDSEVEVVARYNGDVNSEGDGPRPSMAGQAAAIAGTYGKGRLFVFSVHPEVDPADHYILKGAFRYVTGRELSWDRPQRKRGQLAVGVVSDDSFGVDSARFVQRLVTEGEFDVDPVTMEIIASGALRHLDAVVAPGALKSVSINKGLYGRNIRRTREFVARGGLIVAWGSAAEAAEKNGIGVKAVTVADEAIAALRAFAAEPVPEPAPLPGKVDKPLKAVVYEDKGGGAVSIAAMLAISPEYEVKMLSAADYGNGGLEGADLVVQPGGSARTQYNNLGTNGVEALRRFVQDGGKYYGVCAGAFLAAQVSRPAYPRLGLVPFKGDDPSHYRGGAPIAIKLTGEGIDEAFCGSATNRTVLYYGGPAFIEGDFVEDSDVKVLGRYAGRIVNTYQPEPVEEMLGKAAFVGGRVGKGRIFLSCPHPESDENNHDLVRGGIKFLTGVAPSHVNRDRVRGAVSVRFSVSDKASAQYYLDTLMRDRRIDVRSGRGIGGTTHIDVIVLTDVKPDSAATLRRFMERGGRVIVVADTEAKRAAAEKIAGARIVGEYGDLIDEILK